MAAWSPTLEGFRSMFRRPALPLAEVAWRWSFGAAACVLTGLALLEYLDTLPVSRSDMWLLRTRQPWLIWQAFAHILRGGAIRFVLATLIVFSALALLWILFASIGRAATLDAVLDYIRKRAHDSGNGAEPVATLPTEGEARENVSSRRFRSLAGLHFLRAALALAASAACLGSLIVAGFASSTSSPHPAIAAFLATAMLLVVWLTWSSISWFLSLASIFVVRQSKDVFAALSSALTLCRDGIGPIAAVGTWFGLAHLVLFVVATSLITFPLAFVQVLPAGFVLSAVLLLSLLYFATVDALYIGRLAGYVAILEAPPAGPASASASPLSLTRPVSISAPHPELRIQAECAMVDQDEPILGDALLKVQTATTMVDQDEPILSDRPESSSDTAISDNFTPLHD